MFWKEQPIHVIDFEGSPRYGVVEYGVVTVRGGQIGAMQTALCAPQVEMTAKEIALHGIRSRDAAGEPPFAAHRELFFALRKTGVLCAHHASVENRFLKQAWPYPSLAEDCTGAPSEGREGASIQKSAAQSDVVQRSAGLQLADWGPWVDTRALYAAVYPGLESYALGALIHTFALAERLEELAAAHCPQTRRKAHCALYDALASALLLLHLGAEEGFEQLSLGWLLDHSAASAQAFNERRQQELL